MNKEDAIKIWLKERRGNRGQESEKIFCRCGKETKFFAPGLDNVGMLCRNCFIDQRIGWDKMSR